MRQIYVDRRLSQSGTGWKFAVPHFRSDALLVAPVSPVEQTLEVSPDCRKIISTSAASASVSFGTVRNRLEACIPEAVKFDLFSGSLRICPNNKRKEPSPLAIGIFKKTQAVMSNITHCLTGTESLLSLRTQHSPLSFSASGSSLSHLMLLLRFHRVV